MSLGNLDLSRTVITPLLFVRKSGFPSREKKHHRKELSNTKEIYMSVHESSNTPTQRYLRFSVAGEGYAIPLLSVREVVAMPSVTPLPRSPAHLMGVMTLRGQVIPVIDLIKLLNMAPGSSREVSVIICDEGPASAGYVVGSVDSVFSLHDSEISKTSEIHGVSQHSDFVVGVCKKDEALIMLLDLNRLFGEAERGSAAAA
jgi:purine-binding chemotaxis protein CheW